MSVVIRGKNTSPDMRVTYSKDKSIAGYIPLAPNPDVPPPVIPITGAGDMFKAVYDQNNDGKADRVNSVQISEVANLQETLNDLANSSGGGGGGKDFITVTNTGGDFIRAGQPVAQENTTYVLGRSTQARKRIVGIAIEDSDPGAVLKIQLSGYLKLPAEVWDLATDSVGGLGHNGTYFVNNQAQLTLSPPTSSPEYLIKLGHALNSTDFLIDLDIAIKL